MHPGLKLVLITDVDPPRGPLSSPNTVMVFALMTLGIGLEESLPPKDHRERIPLPEGGHRTKRTVTWTLRPKSDCKQYDTAECIRRWHDRAWLDANRDHPLAWIKQYAENYSRGVDFVKSMVPLFLHRRGRRVALVPANASPERKQELLDRLNGIHANH